MKKICILIFLSAVFINKNSFSQELKYKRRDNVQTVDHYFIDRKSEELNGKFQKINKESGDTLIEGFYEKNEKTGLWNYRCKNGSFKYNYSTKELINSKCSLFLSDSFTVRIGDNYVLTKVEIPAVYLGYENELKDIIAFNFKIPISIMENNLSGYTIASINIDTNGKINGVNIEKPFDKKFDKTLKQFLESEIKGDFLPAIYNNSIVESKLFIVIDVSSSPRKYIIEDNSYQIYIPFFYTSINSFNNESIIIKN